jgi:hypothetical protein
VTGNPSEPEEYSSEYDGEAPPAFEPVASGNDTQIVTGFPSDPSEESSSHNEYGPFLK